MHLQKDGRAGSDRAELDEAKAGAEAKDGADESTVTVSMTYRRCDGSTAVERVSLNIETSPRLEVPVPCPAKQAAGTTDPAPAESTKSQEATPMPALTTGAEQLASLRPSWLAKGIMLEMFTSAAAAFTASPKLRRTRRAMAASQPVVDKEQLAKVNAMESRLVTLRGLLGHVAMKAFPSDEAMLRYVGMLSQWEKSLHA